MKVLHVIPSLVNASGPTHSFLSLTRNLARLGVEVSIAYLANRLPDQACPKTNGEVLDCRALRPMHWGYSPDLKRELATRITTFDLVHIHSLWLYPDLISSSLAYRNGVPYIIRPAGSLEPEALGHRAGIKRLYFQLIERKVIDRAAFIHATSTQERTSIDKLGFAPECKIIPNGIEPEDFRDLPKKIEARQVFGISADTPTLVYLGRFHPIKGIDILPEIIAGLRERFPTIKLLMAGPLNTSYAREFQDQILRGGLSTHVEFVGELQGKQKTLALRAADLLLLPSRSENFGVVVAESLAAGTPAITSDQTPWNILRTRDIGDWIPRDTDQWIEAITHRLADRSWLKSAGERTQLVAFKEFSWPNIAEKTLNLYTDICGRKPAHNN